MTFSPYLIGVVIGNIYKLVHLLIHADDVTIIATSKENAVAKMRTLLHYCNGNYIVPQFDKCEFITINVNNYIDTSPLPFGESTLKRLHVNHITLLGSHISASGNIADDLHLHVGKKIFKLFEIF